MSPRTLPTLALSASMLCGGCMGPNPALPGFVIAASPSDAFPVTWDGDGREEQARKEEEAKKTAADNDAYSKVQQADDFDSYLGYLKDYPEGTHRDDAAKAATSKAEAVGDEALRDKAYDKLISAVPAVLEQLPPERAVLYVGPAGMRVRDILAMREQGLGDTVIRSKIAASQKAFKDFSLAELTVLKNLGMPDEIVEAMIQSHAAAEKERKEREEKDALRKEIAELRALVEKQAAAGTAGGAAGGGPTVETADGPLDMAGCIAGRLTAMQLCEQIPWPGSTICKSTAESNFPCGD